MKQPRYARARTPAPVEAYPPEHHEAYARLGIVLGAEDFDEKMAALRYLCGYYHEKKEPKS